MRKRVKQSCGSGVFHWHSFSKVRTTDTATSDNLAKECFQFSNALTLGTIPLSLYLHHQHSQLFLDGVLPFEAENGTRERPKPLFMYLSTLDVHTSLVIRCCPRQKRLRGLVHVSSREHAFPKPCMQSMTKTCHPSMRGNRQKDDQRKEGNCHISPPTERS